ncbi:hypothetical protein WMY93_014250 [Mugilogobius chulae]|uniref:ADP-ribosylation factor-like protein 2 n=1 Tax=Mugilogobius chulae TaxID=88201 RepID=A0AAW0P3Y6_9GOBI
MGLLTILKKLKQKERELRLLMLYPLRTTNKSGLTRLKGFRGLDNAGKTTILKKFNGEDISTISPTLGFTSKPWSTEGKNCSVCSPVSPPESKQTFSWSTEGKNCSVCSPVSPPESKQTFSWSTEGKNCSVCSPVSPPESKQTFSWSTEGKNCSVCSPVSPPESKQTFSWSTEETLSEALFLGPNVSQDLTGSRYKLNMWDVGGQRSLRSYWRNYFESTDGLVWVVDSADRLRLEDCRQELSTLLLEERLAGATLLVFANKQDLPGALSKEAIQEALALDEIKSHHWCILGCSAVTGENLLTGVDWLLDDIAARIFSAD